MNVRPIDGANAVTTTFRASKHLNNSIWHCSYCYSPCVGNISEYICSATASLKIQGKKFLLPILIQQRLYTPYDTGVGFAVRNF